MFPVSIDGEIEIQAIEPQRERILGVLLNVERALISEKANNLQLSGNRISFEAGMFRMVTNMNALVPVGYGEIEVVPGNPGKLKYELSCRQMLTVATVMAVIGGGFAGFGSREGGLGGAFGAFAVAWSCLFGLNYLIAMVMLPRFLRKAVS
jgi:hypothetical protein